MTTLPNPEKNYSLVLILALLGLCMALYWPGVSGGFLFDDYHNIVTNAYVQIKELSFASLWQASKGYSDGTRQLPMVSFALNAYWAGLNPWAYKVTGLVVHAVNTALIGLLALRLLAFSPAIGQRQRPWAALALALVWGVHPLQVSSALYIVQRMETLCFTFLFIALLLYLQARGEQIATGCSRKRLWLGMAVSTLLALLSKENAVLLPLFVLALELCVLHFASACARQARRWKLFYLVSTLLALLVFVAWVLPHYWSSTWHTGRNFSTPERLLTQGRVLVLYLQQMLLPLPATIYFYYDDLPVSTGWLHPISTLVSWLLLATLFGAAWWGRKRYPLAALGVLLFFASHFITSNIIPLEMVFEHRNYFALFGVLLAVVDGISRIPVKDNPKIKYFAVAVLVVGFAFLGVLRAAIWGNPLLLATDMVQKNPQSARAGLDLGVLYYEMSGGDPESPFFQFSAQILEKASLLPESTTRPAANLILMGTDNKLSKDVVDLEKVWQKYIKRLKELHLSVGTRESVWSILTQRLKDKNIDDNYLQQALEIIFSRMDVEDFRHAQAGSYYLLYVKKEDKAIFHYQQSVAKARKNGNQRLIEAIAAELVAAGRPELALDLTGLIGKVYTAPSITP